MTLQFGTGFKIVRKKRSFKVEYNIQKRFKVNTLVDLEIRLMFRSEWLKKKGVSKYFSKLCGFHST